MSDIKSDHYRISPCSEDLYVNLPPVNQHGRIPGTMILPGEWAFVVILKTGGKGVKWAFVTVIDVGTQNDIVPDDALHSLADNKESEKDEIDRAIIVDASDFANSIFKKGDNNLGVKLKQLQLWQDAIPEDSRTQMLSRSDLRRYFRQNDKGLEWDYTFELEDPTQYHNDCLVLLDILSARAHSSRSQ